MSHHERPLRDLRKDAARNRAEFTETVNELRAKVSDSVTEIRDRLAPDAIKAEVGDYVRTRGEMLLDKARENPLQAAAIGAGLAYPLLGIVRSIPAPVLMIGAGLFLLGSGTGQKVSRKAGAIARDVSAQLAEGGDAARRTFHDAQDQVALTITSVKDAASGGLDTLAKRTTAAGTALSEGANQVGGTAADLAASVSTGIGNLKETVRNTIQTAPGAVREGLASAAATVQSAATAATDIGTDAAGKLYDQTMDVSQQSVTALKKVIQQNPLLVGGLGVVIGALIASALPRSDVETGVIGGASSTVKKRVNEAAVQGLETVKEIASTAVAEASHAAERRGLGAGSLQSAAEDLGDRVRKVAENATTTAFELTAQDPHKRG